MDEDEIRTLVRQLARQHSSGGHVIERAAVMAAGGDAAAILSWITDHDGRPEVLQSQGSRGGLHGGRLTVPAMRDGSRPARYILPPGALGTAG